MAAQAEIQFALKIGDAITSGGKNLTYAGNDYFTDAEGNRYFFDGAQIQPDEVSFDIDTIDVIGKYVGISLLVAIAGLSAIQTYKIIKG